MSWFPILFHRKSRENQLDSELRFHLEEQVQTNIRQGMDPIEARREAVLEFGGLEQIKEECRDQRHGVWLEHLIQDLRYGAKSLIRSPGFSLVALLTIAVGIGANTAIFSFVDSVVLKPLPYPNPDELMRVSEVRPDHGWNAVSSLTFLDWLHRGPFKYLCAFSGEEIVLTGAGNPTPVRCLRVSAHYFDLLGEKAFLGRTFVDGEDQPGKSQVVVLTYNFWQTQFGGDPVIVGKTILLGGEPNVVVGVLPNVARLNNTGNKIWRPLAFQPEELSRDNHWLRVLGRLRPDTSVAEARTRMMAVAIAIAHEHPETNRGWGAAVFPLSKSYVGGDTIRSLYVLMAAVGMVLLIACANLASLTLARGIVRGRESGLRAALGASRGRLVSQFLTESALLSVAGGILGIGVAYFGIVAIKLAVPLNWLNAEADPTVDLRVLGFALTLTVLTGIAFGLVPALGGSKIALSQSVRQGGHGSTHGKSTQALGSTLLIGEVALATALLGCATLLIRSFIEMRHVDPGFSSTNVITAWLPTTEKQFPTANEYLGYMHQIETRVASLPGIEAVAFTSTLPLQGWGWGMPFQVLGTKPIDSGSRPSCFVNMVTPSYFKTLGLRLEKGRFLSDQDRKGAPLAIVINDVLAKHYFASTDPIGKQLLVQQINYEYGRLGPEIPWQVVGVVNNEKMEQVTGSDDDNPGFYVSIDQVPIHDLALVVHSILPSASVEQSIVSSIHEVNRDQAVEDLTTLDHIKDRSMEPDRLRFFLISIFSGTALCLAAMGLYGVIAHSVTQRTREIGVRTALGATYGSILSMIIRKGIMKALVGLSLGVASAIVLARLLSSMLFNVTAYDPLSIALVVSILLLTALLASYFPARRAARIDPIAALRTE